MKTVIKNVALLDMRNTTEEAAAQIERIDNAAVVLVTERTKGFLSQMQIDNVALVAEIPADAALTIFNGIYHLSAGLPGPCFLIINGKVIADGALTPEEIFQNVRGGYINGKLLASGAQAAALTACGLHVNGKTEIIPDGAKLRDTDDPLTAAEAANVAQPLYLMRRPMIEPGASAILARKGFAITGTRGAIVPTADVEDFYAVWQGSGSVLRLPENTRFMQGEQVLGRREIIRLRGKTLIEGNLILREDVDEAALAPIEALSVTGKLALPDAILLPMMDRLQNEPDLLPYEGTLLMMDGSQRVDAEGFAYLPERIALMAEGVLAIDPAIAPDTLKQRITMLYYNGVLQLTRAQHAALLPVLSGDGALDFDENEASPASDEAEDTGEFHIIANAATYLL